MLIVIIQALPHGVNCTNASGRRLHCGKSPAVLSAFGGQSHIGDNATKHCGFSIFSNPKLSEHTFQENRGKTNIWIFVERARSMYKFINCRNRNTFYRLAAHWTWNMTSLIDDILLSTIHRALPQFLQPGIWNIAIPLQVVHQQLLSSRRACGNFQGVFISFHKEHQHFEKKW